MSNKQANQEVEVDACGLKCPLPILYAKKALAGMESGQILKVRATDPNARLDFAAFCAQTGHQIIETSLKDGVLTLLIGRR